MIPPFLTLPPTDRVRSSRTGWTRAHWEALADALLDGVAPYASPRGAQYRLPGRGSWSGVALDGLEGFARTFLLAAFRIAGARGAGGAGVERLVERYTRGLDAGTDPASGEAWPALTDCSQQMVEAASVAVALHETKPWIWDRLEAPVQARVVAWLSGFNGARTWDNNWRLFQVVSEQFLASVGAPHRTKDIESGLERLDDWYVGDGWYTDGDGRNFDYYGAWALHFYPLMWARMAGGDTGGRAAVLRERLRLFLGPYPHFFGGDGAPVHQGRSLAYRFAVTAPVWMGALAGCSPLSPGLTRRLASGVARHFVERGVPDERGLLPLGWYGTFLPATQPYSGPASPYWGSKGFLGLLLPPDHPVWTAREAPLPVERADTYTALPAPGWLLHGTRHDGLVRLVNHGSDHQSPSGPAEEDDPHYAKVAYSTATAPETGQSALGSAVDGRLALLSADGTPSPRGRVHLLRCGGRSATSRHEARPAGRARAVPVETTSVLHGPWEIRVHRIRAEAGLPLAEGGHAVAGPREPVARTGPGWALARTEDGLTSAVVALYGWDDGGAEVDRHLGTNAFGTHSATPRLRGRTANGAGGAGGTDGAEGGTSVHVTLVLLGRDAADPEALARTTRCDVEGERVTVRFADGSRVEVG
ncbi:DUF2264 domain-containing protein [Streptomyces sp. DW26H14]|uniref:DUF2264 domain-containing protein n=1 Tax=Streptomyces sp. DW26H14 TaxID=3435395 RepID=UPI00403DAD11